MYDGTAPQNYDDHKGHFCISKTGNYLKTLLSYIDTGTFTEIESELSEGIQMNASNGHGMWKGYCGDLSLFKMDDMYIINLQTGPRTWSGEIVPYGGGGGAWPVATIPTGITLTGLTENGVTVSDDLDIFNWENNTISSLKDGIIHQKNGSNCPTPPPFSPTPAPTPAPTPGPSTNNMYACHSNGKCIVTTSGTYYYDSCLVYCGSTS